MTGAVVGTINDGAVGGYITPINLNAMQQTTKWQGYYGNVNGVITLDDAAGNTMYNWTNADTTGEVYATVSSSPPWSAYTTPPNFVNFDSDEAYLLGAASDNGTNTFTVTSNTAFALGSMDVSGNSRPSVRTDGGTEGDAAWETVLLAKEESLTPSDFLFVGIINDTQPSFLAQNGGSETCDYQLIVADNLALSSQTTYYFYVELT